MLLNSILSTAVLFTSIIPSNSDWDYKINKLRIEYNETKNLPRKLKKKQRKLLNSEYNFILSIKNYNPVNY
jgi:hypothetical protein